MRRVEPGHVVDWATKAAERIDDEYRLPSLGSSRTHRPTISRLAAIIATFAAPLLTLLQESRRSHYHCDDSWYCCGACTHKCDAVEEDPGHEHDENCCVESLVVGHRVQGVCNCGADAWNARVEAVLQGAHVGPVRRTRAR